ncbi:polymorphic toxin-type HINT domain-containing protein [Nonomuraea longicatena]|uniref:Hint domain-containing protein n=1 Tax=Nonomuraea longicatena TaxID=83682 RepID=A0ABN1RC01_9ACTN
MVYDADGERLIRRDPDGTATLYLGHAELRLAGGQVTGKRYYSASDGSKVAMREPGGLRWLLAGRHGSTQLAVDDTTGAVSRERYLPYGKRRGGDDLPFTDLGFLGKTEDASTELTYLGARYYDPSIARFISTDPELDLRTPEWANAYSYAANNPIDLSDPDGRRVDTGGGSGDTSYGYARGNQKNANQNFAKTHHASGKRKSKRERRIHRQRERASEKARIRGVRQRRTETRDAQIRDKKEASHKSWQKEYCRTHNCTGRAKPAGLLGEGEGVIERELADALNPAKKIETVVKVGRKVAQKIHKALKGKSCSSFVPGTQVLMADGTTKPIEKIKVGDKVLATDPETGQTAPRTVTTPIDSRGAKNLVRISVGTADGRSGTAGALIATEEHPFWSLDQKAWIDAGQLRPGTSLQASSGVRRVQVSGVATWTSSSQAVHNLTVDDLHTYYVLAGATPVLVHNSNGCPTRRLSDPLPKGMNNKIASAYDDVKAGRIPSHDTYSGREHPWWAGSKEYSVPGRPKTDRILEKELPNGVKVYGWTSTHYTKIQRFSAPHFPDSGWN